VAIVITLDASVLIAYLDPDDAHHRAAVELLVEQTPPLIVNPITAAEVLVGPTRCGVAAAVWADLLAIGVTLDTVPIDALALAALRVDSRCKLPDCCVLASAVNHQTNVATFDHQLRQSAQAVLGTPG